jgi:hypothetical protein
MLWMDLMRRGEFSAAWTLSDAGFGAPQDHSATPRHFQRIWDGRSLRGRRVLIRCYHGLGDTVQFIRYVPLVKRIAREVIVWAQPALVPLLCDAPGIDRLYPLHDGRFDDAPYDVDVEVMELPHVFRTTLATIPADVPYLDVAPARLPTTPSGELRVGFKWRSGEWDATRSIAFGEIAPLLDVNGMWAVPLEMNVSSSEVSRFHARPDVASISALAATVAALDLVITVDTVTAHLAGALGVRTLLLLHANPDWRWMTDRTDTPWYPHTTLFRQIVPANWTPVAHQVRHALEALTRAPGLRPLGPEAWALRPGP